MPDLLPSSTAGRALIPPDENRRMFDTIARRYDLLNSLISLGQDRAWRRAAVNQLRVQTGGRYVDAGCGTGALCREIAGRFPPGEITLTGIDFSEAMLLEGARRLQRLGFEIQVQSHDSRERSRSHPVTDRLPSTGGRASTRAVTLVCGDALALPFADNALDGVISGFVLRNISDRPAALAEWFRVLRPGGRCVVLELAVPEKPVARGLYRMFTRLLIPTAAFCLSRRSAYVYLLNSIRAFPPSEAICALFYQAGFADVNSIPLTFGAVRIYGGTKP